MDRPSRVEFTDHGEAKARRLARPLTDVAALVLTRHGEREHNPGSADWLVAGRGMVVAYNWPDRGDATCGRVVTLWLER